MVPDADLQVWLDAQVMAGEMVVVPYVKSVADMQINYRMDVIQEGAAGTSRIRQQGRVSARAKKPASLARVMLGVQSGAECSIEIALREGQKQVGVYRFDCPR